MFEEWWKAYPKKVAKLDAMKAWQQVAQHMPALEQMLAILEQQKQSPQWLKDGGEFIPHPASYLRAGRFLDELQIDLGANVNGKAWHETASGVEAKGAEYGLYPSGYTLPDGRQDWQAFRAAVLKRAGSALRAA